MAFFCCFGRLLKLEALEGCDQFRIINLDRTEHRKWRIGIHETQDICGPFFPRLLSKTFNKGRQRFHTKKRGKYYAYQKVLNFQVVFNTIGETSYRQVSMLTEDL